MANSPRKTKRRHFDWESVAELIQELWTNGLSPKAISRELRRRGLGDFPPSNVNMFIGKFRGTESAALRREKLGGRRAGTTPDSDSFRCVICDREGAPSGWNSRFCMECTGRYTIQQINRVKLYNLKPHEFDLMWVNQGGCCAICRCCLINKDGRKGPISKLSPRVDHDHKTGKVRGLLCNLCNWALASVEKEGWVAKAQQYLSADPDHR